MAPFMGADIAFVIISIMHTVLVTASILLTFTKKQNPRKDTLVMV